MSHALEELQRARYVLLTTYRRNGRAVATPVWVVPLDDAVGVWTVRDSGKIKRIRRDPTVTVATCDVRGRHTGQTYRAHAQLLDSDGTAQVRHRLVGKYGVAGRLALFGSRLRRGRAGTVAVRITVDADHD